MQNSVKVIQDDKRTILLNFDLNFAIFSSCQVQYFLKWFVQKISNNYSIQTI